MNSGVEGVVCNKPPLNIELIYSDPLQAIANVFESIDFDFLRINIGRWFHAVIVNGNHVYEEDDQRKGLQGFYADLELLLEALYVINRNTLAGQEAVISKQLYRDKVYLLSDDQAANPCAVVKAFFDMFSIVYIRRELRDWLQAGIDIDKSDIVQIKAIKVLLTYNDLECLLEAAYLYNEKAVTTQLLIRSL